MIALTLLKAVLKKNSAGFENSDLAKNRFDGFESPLHYRRSQGAFPPPPIAMPAMINLCCKDLHVFLVFT